MSGTAKRHTRLLRVRTIERKTAAAKLAAADAKVAGLERVQARLLELKATNVFEAGAGYGATLSATSEIRTRIENARQELQAPIAEAARLRRIAETQRNEARRLEDSAAKLRECALALDEIAAERREAARFMNRRRASLPGSEDL